MSAEKLFEGEIDANQFEDLLRVMFGTQAYTMFTLDRVVAAIVKQVSQTPLSSQLRQFMIGLLIY